MNRRLTALGPIDATLLLFLALRLTLLAALPAGALFQYGDFQHYYDLAAWSLPGHCPISANACWPLLNYWYEFPPLFPYLSIALMHLAGGGSLPPFHIYAYGLVLVMLAADLGTFVLLRGIARRLHAPEVVDQLMWVYALMPAPLILSPWTFDSLTTFWMMLALWALLEKRDGLSAAAIGLGALTKLVPALLAPVIWRARAPRRAIGIALGAGVTVLAVMVPFYVRAPAVVAASVVAQASKSSYATVWAMLDDNLLTPDGQPITGNFGPNPDHFELARARQPLHHSSRVPGWLTLMAAAVVYGGVWWRQVRPGSWDERRTVVLFGFTWMIFVLWSKGWSPQWQQMLVPLILLIQPDRRGMLIALALAAVSFLEWPVLLSRGLVWVFWVTIPLRTALFVLVAVKWAGALRPSVTT